MTESLSILLPVYNAEGHIVRQVRDLLEVAPDLTPDFEVMVIDDGSSDGTAELAAELSNSFPQVRFARHATRRGLNQAIQTGLELTRGQTVLVGDEQEGLSAIEMCRLWMLREDPTLIMSQQRTDAPAETSSWLGSLLNWRADQPRPMPLRNAGVKMVRRQAMEDLRLSMVEGQQQRIDTGASGTQWLGRPRLKFLEQLKRFAAEES